jgi:hypothetical protein
MQQKRLPACEQAGLHYRHEVRAVVLARLQHHDGLRRVRQPIPVLADQRGPLLAWSRGDWSTRDAGEHHSGNRASRRLLIKGISPGNNFVPEFAGFRLSWAQRELSR